MDASTSVYDDEEGNVHTTKSIQAGGPGNGNFEAGIKDGMSFTISSEFLTFASLNLRNVLIIHVLQLGASPMPSCIPTQEEMKKLWTLSLGNR